MTRPDDRVARTVAPCGDTEPHGTHVWTPEPRVINGPKRCPGVKRAIGPDGFTRLGDDRVSIALRVIQKTADTQGNVTMLRLAENLANDAALVRLAQAEGWDKAAREAHDLGWLHAPALEDLLGRNPYREEGAS